jgi:hypothetical protein
VNYFNTKYCVKFTQNWAEVSKPNFYECIFGNFHEFLKNIRSYRNIWNFTEILWNIRNLEFFKNFRLFRSLRNISRTLSSFYEFLKSLNQKYSGVSRILQEFWEISGIFRGFFLEYQDFFAGSKSNINRTGIFRSLLRNFQEVQVISEI